MKKKRLDWIGHGVRMDEGRTDKNIFDSKPDGSKKSGRPRLRWPEDVERELREMKVERGRQKEFGREEWASATKEAKVVRGP
jgi:hypothetical protein